MNEKPRYPHECDKCEFLGRYEEFDLYFCPSPIQRIGGATVIARFGEDDEYCSGLQLPLPELIEAKKRAVERGLLQVTGA